MILYHYIEYLEKLDKRLTNYFESQAPFIFCKKGCAKCCQQGKYPFSAIEYRYLIFGFRKLPKALQDIIHNKILNILEDNLTFEGDNFMYECPFLINNECSLYTYRGIICRTFGLMYYNETGSPKIPFCAFENLNYSNVLDTETKTISEAKYKQLQCDNEPLAFNVSYDALIHEDQELIDNVELGEIRMLIDWLRDDFGT